MLFGHASLSLARLGETDPVVLVPAFEALRLRQADDYCEVGCAEALALVETMASRNRTRVREFVVAARLTRADLRDIDDHRLGVLVSQAIRDGRLVALRPTREGKPVADQTVRRRRLARDIEANTGGRLELAGRRYKLLADVDLTRMRDRDQYEVVGRDAARQVLDALAADPRVSPDLARLLRQAREQLTRDWHPPISEPDGLVLLRRIPAPRAAGVARERAITPSQLRALAAAGWIEIEFVDSLGQPIAAACRLELPDSTPVETPGDGQELVARHGFAPGLCRLSLPKLDAATWRLES
jgi:hypothetical protein